MTEAQNIQNETAKRQFDKYDKTNLIVNYLPLHFREKNLRKLFQEFGLIESCIIMYNRKNNRKGRSKGFGFVKFFRPEDAIAAVQACNGKEIPNTGKTIKVSVARPGNRKRNNLFVSQLPAEWTDKNLNELFASYGHISESRVLYFGNNISRRCGFVRFDTDEEAAHALKSLKGFKPIGSDKPIIINIATNHNSSNMQVNAAEMEGSPSLPRRGIQEVYPDPKEERWIRAAAVYDRVGRYESVLDSAPYGRTVPAAYIEEQYYPRTRTLSTELYGHYPSDKLQGYYPEYLRYDTHSPSYVRNHGPPSVQAKPAYPSYYRQARPEPRMHQDLYTLSYPGELIYSKELKKQEYREIDDLYTNRIHRISSSQRSY